MPLRFQRSFRPVIVLLAVTGPATATEIFNRIVAETSAVENRCFATLPSMNGDDCSTNAGNPSGLGKTQWIGPVFGAGYYAPGAGSQFFGNPATRGSALPLAGTTGIRVEGVIGMVDPGTPTDPTDDLFGGTLEFGAYDRIFDFGDGTLGLERNQPARHGLALSRVTSAKKNAAGGFDYLVGLGVPVLAEANTSKDPQPNSFPSAVASQSTPDPHDKPFWAAPAAVGVATFEGNVGSSTKAEAVPTGYSCATDRGEGPIACPQGPATQGGPAFIFQNVLMKMSTDPRGRITAGQIVLVQERKALPGASENDSWQALTVSFTGTLDAKPAGVNDIVPLKGSKPLTISVLVNDTGLDDKPLTVLIAIKPRRGTIAINPDNTITYTPNPGTASDRFQYRVTDNNADTSLGKVIIGSNSQPVAHDDLVDLSGLRPEQPNGKLRLLIPYLANDTGIDDTPVTARVLGRVAHGAAFVEPVHQQMYYMPGQGFFGTETFRYQLQDVDDDKSTANVSVRGFFALPDSVTGSSGAPLQVDILKNDAGRSDSPVVVSISRPPAHGSVVVETDNTITYTPEASFGGDSFDYTLSDAEGDSATATVNVNVSPEPRGGQ